MLIPIFPDAFTTNSSSLIVPLFPILKSPAPTDKYFELLFDDSDVPECNNNLERSIVL